MRRLLILAVMLILPLGYVNDLYALKFTGRAPQTGDALLDIEISNAFNTALIEANNQVSKYKKQEKLANAFADANAYASNTASMWGYQGYDNIAILGGLSLGAQIPTLDYTALGEALDKVKSEGDAEVGISPSGSINLGLHLGWFSSKAKDWYINVKFFMYSMSYPFEGYTMNYDTMNIGVGVNYALIRARRFGKGAFLWRGLSLGVGFAYQKNELDYKIKLEKIVEEDLGGAYPGTDLVIDPSIRIGLEMNTYTIPIDLVSSLRILYFLNISVGAGVDFNFGESRVIAESDGSVTLKNSPYAITQKGYIKGDASTPGEPFNVRGRLMGGLGINIGPVVLADVQLTYYLMSGVGISLSAGFVW